MEDKLRHIEEGDSQAAGAVTRILREIIRTPTFLELIKVNISGLDRESAGEFVRTLLWEDFDLSMSVILLLPEVVNYIVVALLELGKNLDQLPEALIDSFISQILAEIDVEKIKEFPDTYRPILEKIHFGDRATATVGFTVNSVSKMLNRVASSNPHFVRDALSEIDFRELLRAVWSVNRSVIRWITSSILDILRRRRQD